MKLRFYALLIPVIFLSACQHDSDDHVIDLHQLSSMGSAFDASDPDFSIAAPTYDNPDCPEITLTTRNLNGAGMAFDFTNLEDTLLWWDYPEHAEKTTVYFHNKSDKWTCVIGVTLTLYEKDQIIPDAPRPGLAE